MDGNKPKTVPTKPSSEKRTSISFSTQTKPLSYLLSQNPIPKHYTHWTQLKKKKQHNLNTIRTLIVGGAVGEERQEFEALIVREGRE